MDKIREFFWGKEEEVRAQRRVGELIQKSSLSKLDKNELITANKSSRRLFLRRAATTAGGAAILAIGAAVAVGPQIKPREIQPSIPDWYPSLRLYKSKELPRSLVEKLSRDLSIQKEYPSLSEVGDFLLKNLQEPNNVSDYEPVFKPQGKPIAVKFADIGGALAQFDDKGQAVVTEEIFLKSKNNQPDLRFNGLATESSVLIVTLNDRLLDVNASPRLIRLMLAKEASHLFYFKSLREQMLKSLADAYDIPQEEHIEDILVATAMNANHPRLRIPLIVPRFNKFADYADYAGFGHIVLDLAQMKSRGLLTSNDQSILSYNIGGLNLALERGLIIKDSSTPHTFTWSPNVSPTSEPWYNVMEDVHTTPSLRR